MADLPMFIVFIIILSCGQLPTNYSHTTMAISAQTPSQNFIPGHEEKLKKEGNGKTIRPNYNHKTALFHNIEAEDKNLETENHDNGSITQAEPYYNRNLMKEEEEDKVLFFASEKNHANQSDIVNIHGSEITHSKNKSVQLSTFQRGYKRKRLGFGYKHCSSCGNVKVIGEACCSIQNGTADCGCCMLKDVPQLPKPESILYLNLSHNKLNDYSFSKAGVFADYRNLKNLSLSCNHIRHIEDGMFDGLVHLEYLNIMWNKIEMNTRLNVTTAFKPMAYSLKTLILNGNMCLHRMSAPGVVYPDYALSFLSNISELYLDGLSNKDFGVGFSKLKELRVLYLAGFYPGACNMTSLSRQTFEHVSSITHLNISDCKLNRNFLDQETFSPLTNLEVLDLSNNFGLSLQGTGKLMYGLRNNQNFRHLKIKRIGIRFTPCVVVFKDFLKNFQNMKIEVIEAPDNDIEMIEIGALNYLPSSLKKVNLMNNKIMFGTYWQNLSSLLGLEELELDTINLSYTFPVKFPPTDLRCKGKPVSSTSQEEKMASERTAQKYMTLTLPPQLEKVSMNYSLMAYNIYRLDFDQNNSLKEAYLKGNIFKTLVGPVNGLESLQKLDLSGCYIETMEGTFLSGFKSLESLNLYQNLLGDAIFKDKTGTILNNMSNLRYLNMSFNNIYVISRNFFHGCPNLQILDLSVNRIQNVSFDVSNMGSLSFLGLSKNNIARLPTSTIEHINKILNSGQRFQLDLQFCPIECDCSNIHFLQWVTARNVLIGHMSNYSCVFQDKTKKYMPMGFGDILKVLEHECENHQYVFVAVLCSTCFSFAAILIVIAYRFRWSLRYWYGTVKAMITSKAEARRRDEFEYDAFICYASKDEEFVLQELYKELSTQRGLHLMIHGKNFRVGRMITDNIIMACRQCRKTLIVITKSMLKSKWCLYEMQTPSMYYPICKIDKDYTLFSSGVDMDAYFHRYEFLVKPFNWDDAKKFQALKIDNLQMARMESINTGRSVLVFMFLENIPTKDIHLDIVSYVKSNVVIAYPTDPRHRKAFWDKLARDLKN